MRLSTWTDYMFAESLANDRRTAFGFREWSVMTCEYCDLNYGGKEMKFETEFRTGRSEGGFTLRDGELVTHLHRLSIR